MARTVRTPGATEEPTTEPTKEVFEPEDSGQTESAPNTDEPTTEQVDQSILLEILATQKRIENKLDALAAEAGLKITKPPRFKFDPEKGHVME